MSSDEEYEKLLEKRIAEREARWNGLAKEQTMMNSNYKQPVYTQFSPDKTSADKQSVFPLELDDDDKVSNNVSSIMTVHKPVYKPVRKPVHKPVPTLAELASRKGRLHIGGQKSKKNRRRTSRRHRVRSSRRR